LLSVNQIISLSYTTYYSEFVVAVVLTGLFSDFSFADDVSTTVDSEIGNNFTVVDKISETNLLKACSTLVEFFDDVSTYDKFNDSANA